MMRQNVLKFCKQYQRHNHSVCNVVNCRAYYLLLNALDHQVYQQLCHVFKLPDRAWKSSIFENKLHLMWQGNASNRIHLSQAVYAHICKWLRKLEFMYQPSEKEIKKFQRKCTLQNWTCEFLWSSITEKEWHPLHYQCNIILDTYVPACKRCFETVSFHDFACKLLFHFFKFDYENHLLSKKKFQDILDWIQADTKQPLQLFGSKFDRVFACKNLSLALLELEQIYTDNH